MTNVIKEYIQRNIDVIETDLHEFYRNLYTQLYNNGFVKKLTDVLEEASIDTTQAREDCLYDLLEDICAEATIYEGEQNLHRLLDNESNWYGYTIDEVIEFLQHNSFNLRVQLIPIDDKIFNAPNYILTELP